VRDEDAEKFEERAFVETVARRIVIAKGTKRPRFDPRRVRITWR
jgi:hypothetical protein